LELEKPLKDVLELFFIMKRRILMEKRQGKASLTHSDRIQSRHLEENGSSYYGRVFQRCLYERICRRKEIIIAQRRVDDNYNERKRRGGEKS